MPAGKKFFGFLILLVFIAIIVFFVLGKINPNIDILSGIFSSTVGVVIVAVLGVIVLVAIIRFLRISFGRGVPR